MKENYDKLWLQRSLNDNAIKRAQEAIQGTGRALPCKVTAVNGQIVTVSIDADTKPWVIPPITMPIASSAYDWLPIQIGDTGITMPSDIYLGGISGLGGGTAKLGKKANLSNLVFVPVSNKGWGPAGADPNKRIIQGPNGVFLQDESGAAKIEADKTNGITFSFGGHTLLINSVGITLDGILWDTHKHLGGVSAGTDKTGGPVSP